MSLTQNEYMSTLQLVSSISDRCKTIESLGTAIKYEKVSFFRNVLGVFHWAG